MANEVSAVWVDTVVHFGPVWSLLVASCGLRNEVCGNGVAGCGVLGSCMLVQDDCLLLCVDASRLILRVLLASYGTTLSIKKTLLHSIE